MKVRVETCFQSQCLDVVADVDWNGFDTRPLPFSWVCILPEWWVLESEVRLLVVFVRDTVW